MNPNVSLRLQSFTFPFPEPDQSNPRIKLFVENVLIMQFHLCLGLPNFHFPLGLPTQILLAVLLSPTLAPTVWLIIIINIKDLTLWSVPSPKLQPLSPTFLRSSNCSPSLWSVVVWFQRDSVFWHSLQVLKPVPSVFVHLV